MIYGIMGPTRIPLPACTYTAIRKEFPSGEEEYIGYESDEAGEQKAD